MIVIQNDNSVYTIDGIKSETWRVNMSDGIKFVINEDSELGQKILAANLFFDPVEDEDGKLFDIIAKEPPEINIPSFSEIVEAAKSELAASDYKIIKYMEYQAAGKPIPYDIDALYEEREALRETIRETEEKINN